MNEEVKIYDDAQWGNYGKDIIPSRFYQVYKVAGPWNGDDESLWYSFDSEDKSTISLDPELNNIVSNKYGMAIGNIELTVTITPNETLKSKYPDAVVRVDGVYHDLGFLNNPVTLLMTGDHRISIEWAPELVETFRLCRLL